MFLQKYRSQLLEYRFYLLLPIALLIFWCGLSYLITTGRSKVDQSLTTISHSNEIITKNQQLALLAERLLASRQGYALSGEKGLVTRYEFTKSAATNLIAELSVLMKGDEAQTSRLNEMQHYILLMTEKLDELSPSSKGTIKYKFFFIPVKTPSKDAAALPAKAQTIGSIWNNLMRISEDITLEERKNFDSYNDVMKSQRQKGRFRLIFWSMVLLMTVLSAAKFLYAYLNPHKPHTPDQEEEIFRRASVSTNDGIFEWDLTNDRAFYSKQYNAMLGYHQTQLPGRMQAFKDLLHPKDAPRVLSFIDAYLSGEMSEYAIAFRMQHQSGKWIWINARGHASYDEKGKPTHIIGVHTDISPLKAYEEKLQKAKESAEAANRAKTDFLAHMSHEIRTPLTAISGIAEIFKSKQNNLTVKQKELVRILNSSTTSLKELVNDILEFSKIESGELELDERDFSLKELFDQVISIVSFRANEKKLDFTFDYSAIEHQHIFGDRLRLRQILLNLISNAVKFTDKGGVTITARKDPREDGDFLRINVTDTGIGIEPQNLDLIFERFKQADSSVSRKYGGTGLGLPISLRLAHLMGGDITVESVVNQGSTFTISIPFKTRPSHTKSDTELAADETAVEILHNKAMPQKNILLVEDNEGNIVVLSYLLDELKCHYDVARTGLEAINMWKEKPYDLILMDVQMPEMDGFTATTRIRHMETEKNLPRTPIIGMTAHALIGDKEKCIESGMDTYLPKPIVENDLRIRILKYISDKKVA